MLSHRHKLLCNRNLLSMTPSDSNRPDITELKSSMLSPKLTTIIHSNAKILMKSLVSMSIFLFSSISQPSSSFAISSSSSTVAVAVAAETANDDESSTTTTLKQPLKGYQTREGLIYFDFKEPNPSLPTPKYGQLVSFYYTLYFQEAFDKELIVLDSNFRSKQPFLNKHGNGRVIEGIDDALHTMTVGSRRRLIIPLNLGYNKFAVGPLPVKPENRRALSKYLTLVEEKKGKLVADVELAFMGDDENDQGYYEDIPVSQEEVRRTVGEVQKFLEETKPSSEPAKTP